MGNLFNNFNKYIIKRNAILYSNKIKTYNLKKIHFLVITFSKTGTTSLSRYLSQCKVIKNPNKLINIVHCHKESCWRNIFPFLKNVDFNLSELMSINNRKLIVFQLYREPMSRMISNFIHINHKNEEYLNNDNFITFINNDSLDYEYYEKLFDYSYKDVSIFDKKKKIGFKEGTEKDIVFTTTENISKLDGFLKETYGDKYIFRDQGLGKSNTGNKWINQYVKKFLDNITINKNQLNDLFEKEKYLLGFYYTQDEINEIIQTYIDKTSNYKVNII